MCGGGAEEGGRGPRFRAEDDDTAVATEGEQDEDEDGTGEEGETKGFALGFCSGFVRVLV